jgi:hypothetical protein
LRVADGNQLTLEFCCFTGAEASEMNSDHVILKSCEFMNSNCQVIELEKDIGFDADRVKVRGNMEGKDGGLSWWGTLLASLICGLVMATIHMGIREMKRKMRPAPRALP